MEKHYISLDTCTWIYIANGTEPVKHLEFIKDKLDKGNIHVLVSEIVINEWNQNKDKKVHVGTLKFYDDTLTSLKRLDKLIGEKPQYQFFGDIFNDEEDSNKDYLKSLIGKFSRKKSEVEEAINKNIQTVESIFNHENSILIKVNNEIKLKASELALQRKAPFKSKNSFADALILLSFIDYVIRNEIKGAKFISYNTEDFCEKKESNIILHHDLKPLFEETKSEFFHVVGKVLNTIEDNIMSEVTLRLIEDMQQDIFDEDDFYPCNECEGNNDGFGNFVNNWSEQDVINEYESNHENSKFQEIITGHCDWCNSLHVKCPMCDQITSISVHDYDEKVECNGGCGLIFFVESSDEYYTEDYAIKIIDHRMEKCQKCGEEFINEEGNIDICVKCENEYAYE